MCGTLLGGGGVIQFRGLRLDRAMGREGGVFFLESYIVFGY